jgi:hypothetical protein
LDTGQGAGGVIAVLEQVEGKCIKFPSAKKKPLKFRSGTEAKSLSSEYSERRIITVSSGQGAEGGTKFQSSCIKGGGGANDLRVEERTKQF